MQTQSINLPSLNKPVFVPFTNGSDNRWLWQGWISVMAVTAFIFLMTIGSAPYLHLDEFINVELGRVSLHPNTGWSITWLADKGKPVFLLSYLGPLIEEITFLVFGQYGPRVLGLVGGLAAATAILKWLLEMKVPSKISFLLGVSFLLDPIFVQSYTMARLDGWVIALAVMSCCILKNLINISPYSKIFVRRVIFSGTLTAISIFIWPSAVFLVPLVVSELAYLVIKSPDIRNDWRKASKGVALFSLGALGTILLLLVPIIPNLIFQFSTILEGIKVNTHSGPTNNDKLYFTYYFQNLIELFRVSKFSPVLFFVTIISCILLKNTWVKLAALIAMLVMIATLVYIQRVQYLLPYEFALTSSLYLESTKNLNKLNFRLFKVTSLILLVTWSIGLSIFIRSYFAFDHPSYRDRNIVYEAAKSMIGKGSFSVLTFSSEFYYPGRYLGWKMYLPYHAYNDPITLSVIKKVLPYVTYIITTYSPSQNEEFVQMLDREGVHLKGIYYTYKKPAEKFDGRITNISRLRNLFSIFKKPYGPYALYIREGIYAPSINNR